MKTYKLSIILLFTLFLAGCGSVSNNSSSRTPTETLKALSEAGKNKDAAGIKKLLSKGSLELFEQSAKAQNTTSDKLLTREGGAPFQNITEYGNETIKDAAATVDVKTVYSDEKETIPLVREDGEWKVALDKYALDLQKRLTEQMKEVAPANTNSNRTNTNQPNANQNSAVNENFKSIQNRLRNK